MRFIRTENLQENMILGKTLYDHDGRMLLHGGTALSQRYIEHIRRLQYNGVYIDDIDFEGLELPDIVEPETRIRAVGVIRETYQRVKQGLVHDCGSIEKDMSAVVEDIVQEILKNSDLVLNMVDLKTCDDYTFFHSTNVAILSVVIGVELGFARKDLYELCLAGLLHDIGKTCIPDPILNKPGPLTHQEYELVKMHPSEGYDIIKKKMPLIPVRSYIGILQHHERMDGSGYPNGLVGDKISLFGKILAIADVYDALTSDRPYRKGWVPSEGLEYLFGNCGTHFDLELVRIFFRKISPYPVGESVLLSNGSSGVVIENFPGFGLRPLVRILYEGNTRIIPRDVDLRKSEFSSLVITGHAKKVDSPEEKTG